METKKLIPSPLYNSMKLERRFAKLAAQGWLLTSLEGSLWTFRKIEPMQLRFSVLYAPDASAYDPKPTDAELEKEDLCNVDGWTLAARHDALQVYYTDDPNAVPLETEPLLQVENLYRTLKKRLRPGCLSWLFLSALNLYSQFNSFLKEPLYYLSDLSRILLCLVWVLMAVHSVVELFRMVLWHRKAVRLAEQDVYLPYHGSPLGAVIVLLALAGLLLMWRSSGFAVLVTLVIFGIIIAGSISFTRYMKRKGASRRENHLLTIGVTVLLTLLALSALTGSILLGPLEFLETKPHPVDSYQFEGETFHIYDDPIPLTIEELTGAEGVWSKEAEQSASPLLSYGHYIQDRPLNQPVPTEENFPSEFFYTVAEVKFSPLIPFLRQRMVESSQDKHHDGITFTNHYEPIDPTPYQVEAAYQLHWSDSRLDDYLFFQGNRIVNISFFWEPTQEELAQAAAALLS